VLGDVGVGKSSLLRQFGTRHGATAVTTTLEVVFLRTPAGVVELYDTPGSNEAIALPRNFYRRARGAMFVYSLRSRRSFEHIERWAKKVADCVADNLHRVLVANFADETHRVWC